MTTFPNSSSSTSPSPQQRCHRSSSIRRGTSPLCFQLIANSRIPRPQNGRACFSGAAVRSINRTGDVNHGTSHLQSSAQSACACCQINRQTHTAARQTVRLLVETFPDCPPRAADRNVLNHLTAAVAAVRRASKTWPRRNETRPVTRLNPGDFRNSRYHRSSLNFGLSETTRLSSLSLFASRISLSLSLCFSVSFPWQEEEKTVSLAVNGQQLIWIISNLLAQQANGWKLELETD